MPGIDGFNAGWIKAMWLYVKKPLYNAVIRAKEWGELSQTLRQALISLLPKGDKDNTNWKLEANFPVVLFL